MKDCEGCGAKETSLLLFDYCGECSADLCSDCMLKGHCGKKPASSGTLQDHSE